MASRFQSICEVVRHRGPVFVDTNVILESHRVGSWRALTGGYGVETVEDCVVETHTGFQRLRAGIPCAGGDHGAGSQPERGARPLPHRPCQRPN